MSQINISNNPSAEVIIYENGTPVHVSVEGFVVTWGDIHGTLSAQTDLQNALDAKVPYTGATGNVTLGEYGLSTGYVQLDTTPTTYTPAVGNIGWNDTVGTIQTTLKGGTSLMVGRDMFERVVNKTGVQLTRAAYQAVRISTAQGQRLGVALAQANNDNNSADTIGLAVETIDVNQEGMIFTVGEITGINTTGSLQGETWADGDVLYLSPTVAGRITNVKPVAPQHLVVIGYVTYAHQNNGKLYVKVMNGWEIGELHDVRITSPTNGQVLKYNSSLGVWENNTDAAGTGTVTQVNATGGTGISVSGSPITTSGTLTITNTAPDQVVSLTQGGTTTITGTYPNFTVSSADQYQGTVTSASVVSANGFAGTVANSTTTPAITLSTSVTGLLKGNGTAISAAVAGTDYQAALTNPVTGTGTSGQVSYWAGTTLQSGSNNLYWNNANGRLGIGTSTLTGTTKLRILADAFQDNLWMDRFAAIPTFIFRRANGTESSPTAVLNNDSIGAVGFRGYNGSDFTAASQTIIYSYATENWTTGATGSDLRFETTATGSTTRSEKMRIFSGGNVTIQSGGTFTDAGFRLDVNGTTRTQGQLTVSTGGAAVTGLSSFTGTTASDGGQLGSELLSSANWTLGAGWTGDFATGFAHSSGTATLTNTLAAVNGNYYLISYTVTNRTAGTFTIAFGGYTSGNLSATGSVGPRATSTASLTITPTTDFNGTIVFSIKVISASSASIQLRNSSGTITNEIRNDSSNTNVIIGTNAGTRNLGTNNTFIGNGAGQNNTSGFDNTFYGYLSGQNVSIGAANSLFGSNAGVAISTGSNNSLFGASAGQAITSGLTNSLFGAAAGISITTGERNCFFGFSSGTGTTTQLWNSFFGTFCGQSNTGSYNSAFGEGTLSANQSGSYNSAFGQRAGRLTNAGSNLTTTDNSIFIGADSRANAISETNQIVIGYQGRGLGSNTTVIGNSSTTFGRWWGNLLLGTSTNSTFLLDVNGTARVTGATTITGSTTASSGVARGTNITSTLVAAANNDTLVGLDINPTFTNGAFTGVTNTALRVIGNLNGTFPAIIIQNTSNGQSATNVFRAQDNSTGVCEFGLGGTNHSTLANVGYFYTNKSILDFYANAGNRMRIYGATGNIVIQNGGTFTDNGYRLDVQGTLRVTGASQFEGNVTVTDADNLVFGTTTGTKIGTSTSQKLAFYNSAPIVQPTTGVAAATRVSVAGNTVTDADTFDGYTIPQLVKAMRNLGLLA